MQLENACRAGNQQACQRLAGYGIQPPGQQQCGPTNMGGGIIGAIFSLFGRSNNNCPGGGGAGGNVPTPTCQITASPSSVATAGQPVTLSWQSNQAYAASLSNAGNVPVQGSMTVNPQTTTTYTLFLQGARNSQTGQQLSGQCQVQVQVGAQGGGSTDGDPKAQISCSPQVADVGMSVAISFACQNSVASGGNGFSTDNQMSGSAAPVVEAPTLGSSSVTYGLTCSREGKTDTAQCTVQINKPSIVLVANPRNVGSGQESNIGWVTGGMEACTISSPTLSGFTAENAGNTSVSGVAKTPQLTGNATFVLSCTTRAGSTRTAEVTVEVD